MHGCVTKQRQLVNTTEDDNLIEHTQYKPSTIKHCQVEYSSSYVSN